MDRKRPFILSIIGESDSGKTTLILKILPELKNRGYRIAVAKHCPQGFDLDIEGKDSWKFSQAGAQGTFLSSPQEMAVIRTKKGFSNLKERLQNYFSDFDFILMEGYKDESEIKKIQIIRKGVGGKVISSDKIIAYISDIRLSTEKPIFKPKDISGIVSFIERQSGE